MRGKGARKKDKDSPALLRLLLFQFFHLIYSVLVPSRLRHKRGIFPFFPELSCYSKGKSSWLPWIHILIIKEKNLDTSFLLSYFFRAF